MLQIKVGIQLASLRLPFRKALEAAARLGAQAVEIDARGEIKPRDLTRSAVRQVRKMLDDLNLRVCAVGFHTRGGYNASENLEARIEATKEAMQMAYDLGAPAVVNQVGRIPSEPAGPAWDLLLQSLAELGRFGQHVGAVVAAETGSESGVDLARLIAALPPGSLGVNFDPGNLVVNNFSPTEALAALADHVVHVHAKDGVRDLAQGRGVEVPLGRGSVDFAHLLAVLEEHQYRGYFTIEREHADDPLHEVGQAVSYLKSL